MPSNIYSARPMGLGVNVRQEDAKRRPFSSTVRKGRKKSEQPRTLGITLRSCRQPSPRLTQKQAANHSIPQYHRHWGNAEGVRGLLLSQSHRQAPFSNLRAQRSDRNSASSTQH